MPDAILILNAGSSSIKFSVFALGDDDQLALDARGQVERIGSRPHFVAADAAGGRLRNEVLASASVDGHAQAMRHLGEWVRERLADDEVVAVGHRVVHGGPDFAAPVADDDAVLAKLEALVPLARLHQPHNLTAIRVMRAQQPGRLQVACFDTAVHRAHPSSPTGLPWRAALTTTASAATASTAFLTTRSQAIDLFVWRIGRELGALAATLGGLGLLFTAGIGERSAEIRARMCERAAWLGIELDDAANEASEPRISTTDSKVAVFAIPTDEEQMVARHTLAVLRRASVAPPPAVGSTGVQHLMRDDSRRDAALSPGKSFPIGASVGRDGVNFSLFSRNATGVELLLFEKADDAGPARIIRLDPASHRTYHYWHVFVPGVQPGQVYGYRVDGPREPEKGLRFDPAKLLLDPYGRAVAVPERYDRAAACRPGDNAATAMKSVVVDCGCYDWEGDQPLYRPFLQTVIYEMHVGGFTRHPSSAVAEGRRGTYAGLIEKIPYLQDLGITAVELLPVFQYDPFDGPAGLVNYWGYSPVSFFAPHAAYSSRPDPCAVLDEFRDMVKALHRAGIEVILDVVYNHTAEGDHRGPTLCFRGLDNDAYYILQNDRSRYADYSGTGNSLNANHPIVRRLIVDSLRYWVEEMHVDGFRFDLASILARDESGVPLANPPVLWDIETDPSLAGIKLIAEAWDAAGLYQVGSFIGDRWKEWNGRFRDDVRSFVRGEPGMVSKLAARFLASPDIFGHEEREPEQSINFITCHDGFTLNDLVSYDAKHNEANRADNRDGSDDNRSWNCGVEGPTDDPEIDRLRTRQIKNCLTITLLALGTPMLLMGDEARRTQGGNNNAYCQDNEVSWLDWRRVERQAELIRFVQRLIGYRRSLDLAADHPGLTLNQLLRQANIRWHGVQLDRPDWSWDSHSLAFTAESLTSARQFHVLLNAYWEPLAFELPPAPDNAEGGWRRIIDTACDCPDDFCDWPNAPEMAGATYLAEPRSIVVFVVHLVASTQSAV